MDVHLDVIHADDAALVADLERRLGGTVMYHEVNDIDYERETMIVDVRYRAGTGVTDESQPEQRRLDVRLDVIHADDAALVADLERRLSGRVVRHEVKDIDYVRDTMVVDVRYLARARLARPALAPANQARPDQAAPSQGASNHAASNRGVTTGAVPNQAAPNLLRPVAPAAAPQLIGRSVDERTVVVKR